MLGRSGPEKIRLRNFSYNRRFTCASLQVADIEVSVFPLEEVFATRQQAHMASGSVKY